LSFGSAPNWYWHGDGFLSIGVASRPVDAIGRSSTSNESGDHLLGSRMAATWIPLGGWSLDSVFHNLRKAVSDYLNEGKKVDVRTIQDTLRHEAWK
jgi:hypothetical protein